MTRIQRTVAPVIPYKAKGRRGRPRGDKRMNKTEERYSNHLAKRKLAGEIHSYYFESIKLRLADKTWYNPDFTVFTSDGYIEIHEVKGHWEDDARVKIKTIEELFPELRFVMVHETRKNSFTYLDPHGNTIKA